MLPISEQLLLILNSPIESLIILLDAMQQFRNFSNVFLGSGRYDVRVDDNPMSVIMLSSCRCPNPTVNAHSTTRAIFDAPLLTIATKEGGKTGTFSDTSY